MAQLNGSLFVIQEDDDIAMQLWHKGELLAESFGKDADNFYLLFGTYFPQAGSNLHPMPFEEIERALRFPLLLPGDWEMRWSIKQISEHIFLAEDKEASVLSSEGEFISGWLKEKQRKKRKSQIIRVTKDDRTHIEDNRFFPNSSDYSVRHRKADKLS